VAGGWLWDVDRVKGASSAHRALGCGVPGVARADHAWQLLSVRDRGHPKGDLSAQGGSRADDRADETSGVSGWRSLASVDTAGGMAGRRG
jgi:hypothetical protein